MTDPIEEFLNSAPLTDQCDFCEETEGLFYQFLTNATVCAEDRRLFWEWLLLSAPNLKEQYKKDRNAIKKSQERLKRLLDQNQDI